MTPPIHALRLLSACTALLCAMTLAGAQEGEPTPAAPDPKVAAKAKLTAAFEKLAAAKDVVFSGRYEREDDPESGGVKTIVIGGAGGGGARNYEGAFEVWLTSERRELVVASKRAMPGMAIYDDGERTLRTLAFDGEEFSTKRLSAEVPQLFDLANLRRYVGRATDLSASEKEGASRVTCRLSTRFLRSAGGSGPMAGLFRAKILEIEATFDIDSAGELRGMQFQMLRQNPMAGMMSRGNVRVEGSGGELPEELEERLRSNVERDKLDGYRFTRLKAPTERLKRVLKTMRAHARS